MSCAPPGPFITSILELKLDDNTSFEWQKSSQDLPDFPHYDKLLAFLNLRAQASEASYNVKKNVPCGVGLGSKALTSFMANASDSTIIVLYVRQRSTVFHSVPNSSLYPMIRNHLL